MKFIELLDKIDETAPRSCETCRHMATHSRCNGCLSDTPRGEPFPYRHWEPGNWLREKHAAEVRGTLNIVVGGSGEADFCALAMPEDVAKHLEYVAEMCGYYVGRLATKGDSQSLSISTHEGTYTLHWLRRTLERISRRTADGPRDCWRRDNPSLNAW
jgi:hypothetical protein